MKNINNLLDENRVIAAEQKQNITTYQLYCEDNKKLTEKIVNEFTDGIVDSEEVYKPIEEYYETKYKRKNRISLIIFLGIAAALVGRLIELAAL